MNTNLEDIASVIGFTATLKLAAWFGDGVSNCYVPKQARDGDVLVELIGMSAARRMCATWPGKWLNVPGLSDFEVQVRRRTVARLTAKQMSAREIAGVLRMSVKRVQQIQGEVQVFLAKMPQKNAPQEEPPVQVEQQSDPAHLVADAAMRAMVGAGHVGHAAPRARRASRFDDQAPAAGAGPAVAPKPARKPPKAPPVLELVEPSPPPAHPAGGHAAVDEDDLGLAEALASLSPPPVLQEHQGGLQEQDDVLLNV